MTMEAEKLWEEWDFENANNGSWDYVETSSKAREAYKSQLKKLIEERIADYGDRFRNGSQESGYIESGELKWVLELLDNVKPPQP